MNYALDRFARDCFLAEPANERLRLNFGYGCAMRVKHLLEEADVEKCLCEFGVYLHGHADRDRLARLVVESARLANHHQGSKSIDGCGHAAVSATYAVAKAIEGKALEAASYAAYATVYAQGGYAAAADPESFESEFRWQLGALAEMASHAAAKA